jgi:tetrahydromethanopterin S-methyltransferase subunit G
MMNKIPDRDEVFGYGIIVGMVLMVLVFAIIKCFEDYG